MPFRKPFRILILALIAIAVAVAVRRQFHAPAPLVEEDAQEAPMRVARDVSPTIVEPNDNWLESATDAAEPGSLPDSHSPVLLPNDPPPQAPAGAPEMTR
jgi:hypothetical protein